MHAAERKLRSTNRPGLRLSVGDVAFGSVCIAAGFLLTERLGAYAWTAAVVMTHFFLFCNVFRVRRRYELAWAACFSGVFLWHAFARELVWSDVLLWQTPFTALAIGLELASANYHGVCWRTLAKLRAQ